MSLRISSPCTLTGRSQSSSSQQDASLRQGGAQGSKLWAAPEHYLCGLHPPHLHARLIWLRRYDGQAMGHAQGVYPHRLLTCRAKPVDPACHSAIRRPSMLLSGGSVLGGSIVLVQRTRTIWSDMHGCITSRSVPRYKQPQTLSPTKSNLLPFDEVMIMKILCCF